MTRAAAKKSPAAAAPELEASAAGTPGNAAPAAASRGGRELCALDDLRPWDGNPRRGMDETGLAGLAASIERQGLLENLVVQADGTVVAGNRRYRALCLLAGAGKWDRTLACIPVLVVAGEPEALRILALIENLQREDLPPLEEAEAYAALIESDPKTYTTETVAAAIGKSRRHVQLRLALIAKLIPAAKKMLAAGEIDLATARELATAPAALQRETLRSFEQFGHALSAQSVRDRRARETVPLALAAFPVERYTGPFAEDPETGGRTGFADTAAFDKLQKQAAAQKAAELRKAWAWAEVAPYFAAYDYGKSRDESKAGCVVVLGHSREIEVHTGLVKRAPSGSGARPKSTAAEKKHRELVKAREKTGAEFRAALGAALVKNPSLALRYNLCGTLFGGDDAAVSQALGEKRGAAMAALLEKGDDVALWRALEDLSGAELLKLNAARLADGLPDYRHYASYPQPLCGVESLAAQALGVAVPAHMRPWEKKKAKPAGKKATQKSRKKVKTRGRRK